MTIEHWNLTPDGKLKRVFTFSDFIQAFAFMTQIAMVSEKQQHHPHWENIYHQVTIYLYTHDLEDAVTSKDYKLALSINELYEKYYPTSSP
jgi:4a-hydroxytetrahydrobiopterin dehydratase